MASLRVGILTVSDTAASQGSSADRSGPAIRSLLEASEGYSVTATRIVPDEQEEIRSAITEWCKSGQVDWILTTGGTGFGARDYTPEAVSTLITRPAPGLVHLIMSTSLKHTPLAALSRPVAGTIESFGNPVLVVTLPGSVKAVRENMDALLTGGVVKHALELVKGGSGQAVHKALADGQNMSQVENAVALPNDGHHHHHHHHHHHGHGHQIPTPRTVLSHDPSQPVSLRNRVSPFPLIDPQDAIAAVLTTVQTLPITKELVTPTLRGYVLAEDVHAPQDVPSSKTTNVDGYALRSTDPPGVYRVVTPTTHSLQTVLPAKVIYRINTGAPLPAGADAVIMVEDTKLISTKDGDDNGEELEIETLAQVESGENVRAPGSDVRKGELVLRSGQVLRSVGGEIGTLAFVGRKEVSVVRKPVVGLISTGNELADLQSPRASGLASSDGQWSGIWDTNRPSLQAALEGLGYEVIDYGIVADTLTAHTETLRAALSATDIIISTGGTSMGPSDLLKPVIERELNGTVHFGRVKVKPGKPTTFATVPIQGNEGRSKPIFALPGNPASALVCFFVFVVPALRRLGGWKDTHCQLPRVNVKLQSAMPLDPRPEFHRVTVRSSAEGLKAYTTGGQRSSRASSLAGANAFVALPAKSEGKVCLDTGEAAEAIIVGEIEMDE